MKQYEIAVLQQPRGVIFRTQGTDKKDALRLFDLLLAKFPLVDGYYLQITEIARERGEYSAEQWLNKMTRETGK